MSENRLYDPKTGSWLSHDALGYIDSPNLYSYCSHNPIDFVDPLGLGKDGKSQNSSNDESMLDRMKKKANEVVDAALVYRLLKYINKVYPDIHKIKSEEDKRREFNKDPWHSQAII